MIVYEVNLDVNTAIFESYLAWLKPHIQDILALQGFVKADLLFDNEQSSEAIKKVTVVYYLKDYESYSHYLETYATKMREDAMKRFDGQFSAKRRVLELDSSYSSNE